MRSLFIPNRACSSLTLSARHFSTQLLMIAHKGVQCLEEQGSIQLYRQLLHCTVNKNVQFFGSWAVRTINAYVNIDKSMLTFDNWPTTIDQARRPALLSRFEPKTSRFHSRVNENVEDKDVRYRISPESP